MKIKKILLENRKAKFNYQFLDTLIVGLVLFGSEVKSIINNDSSITEGYCYITSENEIFIKGFTVQEYKNAIYTNHNPSRDKKLLANKKEIEKWNYQLHTNQGLTIMPTKLFVSDNGKIKLEIALCRGKKQYDKRNSLKIKDLEREYKQKFS